MKQESLKEFLGRGGKITMLARGESKPEVTPEIIKQELKKKRVLRRQGKLDAKRN